MWRPNRTHAQTPAFILMAVGSMRNVSPDQMLFFIITLFSLLIPNSFGSVTQQNADQIYSIEVVKEFSHDPAAFTQGLLYGGDDTLFESTGLNGHIKTFSHHMRDGWGFATDGKVLFGSDGSSTLYKINPQTMEVIQEHVIKYKDHQVYNLNELEYINNEVWANIWQSDCIVRISPSDGTVTGWILLPELSKGLIHHGYTIDVLNGIAWDADNNRIFVTGKLWPKLYQIKLHPHKKPLSSPIEKMCLRGSGS
ncbi:putative glutaminyl-peptide cyclotransferase transcription factor WD40-like family [Helianthus annuus]|nr:putative glutaminyl-peptide cyclotransferase transcription factor WD40-like family [Helianthus annuus]